MPSISNLSLCICFGKIDEIAIDNLQLTPKWLSEFHRVPMQKCSLFLLVDLEKKTGANIYVDESDEIS